MKKPSVAIDFYYLLLDYYKKLKISEEELAVILMISHLQKQNKGNKLISIDMLALKMTMDEKEIDKILSKLLERGFLTYEETSKGGLKSSLSKLEDKLYELFSKEILKEQTVFKDKENEQKIKNLYASFERTFKRSLAPVELDRIDEWLRNGISVELIEYSLKEAELKKTLNMRSVERILKNLKKEKDNLNEGHSLGDSSIEDEETKRNIEILKEDWTK